MKGVEKVHWIKASKQTEGALMYYWNYARGEEGRLAGGLRQLKADCCSACQHQMWLMERSSSSRQRLRSCWLRRWLLRLLWISVW